MKTMSPRPSSLASPWLLGVLAFCAVGSLASQELNKIGTRALSPQEIKTYQLPAGTVKSPGIPTVGIGDPVYLEVQVAQGTIVSNVVWSLPMRPGTATATLQTSPLGIEIPIYNLGDRAVARVADRRLLVPDAPGIYLVTATVATADGTLELSKYITAANYVGVGTIDGTKAVWPQCGLCHEDENAGWNGTAHANALIDKINAVGTPGDHFASHCLSCHTTGYNTAASAVNSGFDDIATAVGWSFPTEAGEHWAEMPNALKQKSNVQCEACHGPGSEHFGQSAQNQTSLSTSAGDCAQCHDSAPYHTIVDEWNLSRHAVATRYPTGENRASCVRCHSGVGFIQFTDDKPITVTDYEAITCQVCHDPHSGDNHHQLREVEAVLANGVVVTGGGAGRLCMNCHQSRQNAATYATEYRNRFGPHYAPQSDMLVGSNGFEFGRTIPSSGHLTAVENSCIGCHMHQLDGGDPALHAAGGHTWKMTWDNGTPDIMGDDVPMVGSCQKCHGESVQDFNLVQEDYDGDGILEGVQDEVRGLLDYVAMQLPPIGEPTVNVTADYTPAELGAAFNYIFIEEDRSFGVHNTSYAVGLLRASIEAIMIDDSDGDGLLDGFEMAYYGNLNTALPDADDDGDGLTNLEEQQLGTNPKLRDSDGDGYDDRSEVIAGFDPNDANDNPDFMVRINPAVEFLFYTEAGKMYQIQSTEDLGAPQWINVGQPIQGGDQIIQTFFSLAGKSQEYYRAVEVQ